MCKKTNQAYFIKHENREKIQLILIIKYKDWIVTTNVCLD